MDIWETDKLALFLAFVIPGFLSLKTYAVLGLRSSKDSSQQLIDAIAFSCINYAILAWPILQIEASGWRQTLPRAYFAFYGFALLVAPVLWGFLWLWLRKSKLAQTILPHPTERPWDYVFGKRTPYWVIVSLRDGRKIAGRYAEKSFASAAPASEQIYLEEVWMMSTDGGFERAHNDSAGILILGSDIVSVELLHYKLGQNNGNQLETSPRNEGMAAGADETNTR